MHINPIHIIAMILLFIMTIVVSESLLFQRLILAGTAVTAVDIVLTVIKHLTIITGLSVLIAAYTSSKTASQKYRYQHMALHVPMIGVALTVIKTLIFEFI